MVTERGVHGDHTVIDFAHAQTVDTRPFSPPTRPGYEAKFCVACDAVEYSHKKNTRSTKINFISYAVPQHTLSRCMLQSSSCMPF